MPEVKWEAESLRATAFYNIGDAPQDVTRLWELIMHRGPEQVSSRPNEGLHIAEGPFGGSEKQLQCTIRPERVDWVLRPAPRPPNQSPEGLTTIGGLEEVLPSFRDLGVRWLERSPAVVRLAFGAVLVVGATTLQDANEKLVPLLPSVSLDPRGISEFLYRVNRRRPLATAPGTPANRITTWSIAQGGSIGFVATGDAQPQLTHVAGHFACRLELDVNTVGAFSSALSGAKVTELFLELVSLGKEIAEKGDIP